MAFKIYVCFLIVVSAIAGACAGQRVSTYVSVASGVSQHGPLGQVSEKDVHCDSEARARPAVELSHLLPDRAQQTVEDSPTPGSAEAPLMVGSGTSESEADPFVSKRSTTNPRVSGATFIFVLSWLLLLPIVVGAALTYDQLLRIEYSSWREVWERDGRPRGYFWSPPELRTAERLLGMSGRMLITWLFRTPNWIRAEPEARVLLQRLKKLEALGLVVIAIAFAVGFWAMAVASH